MIVTCGGAKNGLAAGHFGREKKRGVYVVAYLLCLLLRNDSTRANAMVRLTIDRTTNLKLAQKKAVGVPEASLLKPNDKDERKVSTQVNLP